MKKELDLGVLYCDNEDDFNNAIVELDNNLDFNFLGEYDLINDIEDEFEYHGVSNDDFMKMTNNIYGNCIEIVEYANRYTVYYGAR